METLDLTSYFEDPNPALFKSDVGFAISFFIVLNDEDTKFNLSELIWAYGGRVEISYDKIQPSTIILVDGDTFRGDVSERIEFGSNYVTDCVIRNFLLPLSHYAFGRQVVEPPEYFYDVIYYRTREFKELSRNYVDDDPNTFTVLSSTLRLSKKIQMKLPKNSNLKSSQNKSQQRKDDYKSSQSSTKHPPYINSQPSTSTGKKSLIVKKGQSPESHSRESGTMKSLESKSSVIDSVTNGIEKNVVRSDEEISVNTPGQSEIMGKYKRLLTVGSQNNGETANDNICCMTVNLNRLENIESQKDKSNNDSNIESTSKKDSNSENEPMSKNQMVEVEKMKPKAQLYKRRFTNVVEVPNKRRQQTKVNNFSCSIKKSVKPLPCSSNSKDDKSSTNQQKLNLSTKQKAVSSLSVLDETIITIDSDSSDLDLEKLPQKNHCDIVNKKTLTDKSETDEDDFFDISNKKKEVTKSNSITVKSTEQSKDDDPEGFGPCSSELYKRYNTRAPYTKHEKENMLKFILHKKRFQGLRGNGIWKEMEKSGYFKNRSYQSLKNHFLKSVLLQLDSFSFLTHSDKQKLKGDCND